MQSLHRSWEVLIYLQGILLDTPPGITLRSSTGAPSWFFLRTFSSLVAVPWLYVRSGPALMNLLFWWHCKTGDKGSWSEETSEWNGTSAVIQCNFSAHEGALILCANLSRNGELSTSTHSESGWLPERTIVETHYRSLVSNSTDFPFHPEEGGLWAWKCTLRHHHLLLHRLPGRTAEVRTEADSGSSVLAASNHYLWLEQQSVWSWFVSREAAMDLSLIAVNSLNEKIYKEN